MTNITIATTTPAPCFADCVPEGFWILVGTSLAVMICMTVLIVWVASPRLFCQCCSQVGRGMRDIRSGLSQVLLEARGRSQGGIEEENYWEAKPQTKREMEMTQMRERRAQEEKEKDKDQSPPSGAKAE